MSDGMKKNLEVVQEEVRLYGLVIEEQWERMKREPSWRRKLHVLSGLEPDAHRTLPRTLSYANRILWVLTGLLIIGVAAWWYLR